MTSHKIFVGDSSQMSQVSDETVNLIVTSPPYPMVGMWDEIFSSQNEQIKTAITDSKAQTAFRLMHSVLNKIWAECDRVLAPGGFICINIGDATRTFNGKFQLFSNHTEVVNFFSGLGYSVLPDIHWRKRSNAPNKFMGSGMYPAGAYVTYEHEYILIFRKGGKRDFSKEEKIRRRKSAYFWEERNVWFSDLWEIRGVSQNISADKGTRNRSAAFPLEIPYRLINMYSLEGDLVLDPFAGLGTTNVAAAIAQRNSVGFDIDPQIALIATDNIFHASENSQEIVQRRLSCHEEFIRSLPAEQLSRCYANNFHGVLVKTRQEVDIAINKICTILPTGQGVICEYC